LDVVNGNVFDSGFEDESFDAIISRDFCVRGYLQDGAIKRVLNEHYRLLKPGGHAIFTTMCFMNVDIVSGVDLPPPHFIVKSKFKGYDFKIKTINVGMKDYRKHEYKIMVLKK
ncbi:class I SAM-dependent methyltransferase, partial [Nanoarchaeota archaeon]